MYMNSQGIFSRNLVKPGCSPFAYFHFYRDIDIHLITRLMIFNYPEILNHSNQVGFFLTDNYISIYWCHVRRYFTNQIPVKNRRFNKKQNLNLKWIVSHKFEYLFIVRVSRDGTLFECNDMLFWNSISHLNLAVVFLFNSNLSFCAVSLILILSVLIDIGLL